MGLANLSGLLCLLSVPVLIYIYYFSRKKKRVEISSIIPWRLLRESVVRSSLFRADLLFYLQLLLLLSLSLAAAAPYWRAAASAPERRGHFIVVMDRSASMQTVEGGKRRFDLARERALRVIARMRAGDRATLIGAAAGTEVLASGEGNRASVEGMLRGMTPADTPDRLAPALRTAVGLWREGRGGRGGKNTVPREETELYVFTDRSAESLGLGRVRAGGSIHVERVGSPKGNAALTSLSVYQDLFSPRRQASVYVTAENLSHAPYSGTLRASCRGKQAAAQALSLGPGEARTMNAGEGMPEGILEIAIDPQDLMAVDNRVYAVLPGKRMERLALVTRDGGFAARFRELAAAIPHLTLDVLSPASYAAEASAQYRVVIFHRCEPDEMPPSGVLLICPPVKSRVVRVAGEWAAGVRFLDWDESHPVGGNLRGLNNVAVSGSRVMETPPWAQAVAVSATRGGDIPLVLCGEYRGRRAAVTGFDLAEIELRENHSLPALILLLNLLSWLGGGEGSQICTGDVYTGLIPGDERRGGSVPTGGEEKTAVTVINPRGAEERVRVKRGEPLLFAGTDYAGRYLVSGGLVEKIFVANLCNRAESDLLHGEPGDDKVSVEDVVAMELPPVKAPDRSALFLIIVVAVFLLEWLLWAISRS